MQKKLTFADATLNDLSGVAEVQLDQVDSYSLASLLKMYLRDLPKAVIDDSIVVRLYNAVDLCKSYH